MNDLRLTITGPMDEIEALELFCRKSGVHTERGLVSSYAGVAVSALALHAIGSFDVLAQCLATYGTAHKPSLKVTYFITGKGQQAVKDYTFDAMAEVLRKTQELHFERDHGGNPARPRA